MNEELEKKALDFVRLLFEHVPHETLQKWGMKRYSRFKTKCWKHFESSENIDQFSNNFFKFDNVNLAKILTFLEENSERKQEIFWYARKNLTLLVGRIWAKNKEIKKDE